METLADIFFGFRIAIEPQNLFFCFLGCLVGTLIGVLPGIGPGGTLALLLPITYYLPATTATIMLAGIYYGAMYGGSTTSILVNIPGEAASVITCLDGYQMARNGRAGPALGMSAFGSYIAGTLSILGLCFLAPPLANLAMKFTSPEYVAIIIFGLTLVSYLGSGSKIKTFMMAIFGILIGTIGSDPVQSVFRFTLGNIYLLDGIGLIPVAMGLFGISEVFSNLEEKEFQIIIEGKIKSILPTLQDWIDSKYAILRGTIIGFFIGILPGGNAIISSMLSYAAEKKISKYPEKFGTGVIEGVAGPESANNASATASFVPLLSLGMPTNAVMALLLAGIMIHGIIPGPLLIKNHPDLFWSLIASMNIGNLMLLALNLPLIGLWIKLLKTPYPYLFPLILLFCLLGAFSLSNTVFDIYVMIFFGVIGFFMKKLGYDAAPLILAYILGPMLEENLRRSLIISEGSFWVFLERPISSVFIISAILLIFLPALKNLQIISIKIFDERRKK
jgi:putative tricarboxylic transport membrane protein